MSCGAPAALREREKEIAGGACGGGVVVMMMTMDAQLGRCCLHSFLSYLRIFAKLVWVKSTPKYISLCLSFSLNKEKISKVS